MSKERLEEINKNVLYIKKNSLTPNEIITWSGWKSILSIFTEDLEYLQEQTEQKQALETTIDFYQSALRDADWQVEKLEKNLDHSAKVVVETAKRLHQEQEQNERYRKALTTISANLPLDGREHYVAIAREALEEE